MRRISLTRVLLACGLAGVAAEAGGAEEVSFVRLTPAQYQRAIHDIFGRSVEVDDRGVDSGVRENGLLALGARKLTLTAATLE